MFSNLLAEKCSDQTFMFFGLAHVATLLLVQNTFRITRCNLFEEQNFRLQMSSDVVNTITYKTNPCKFFKTKTVFAKTKTFDFFQDQDHKNGMRINSYHLSLFFYNNKKKNEQNIYRILRNKNNTITYTLLDTFSSCAGSLKFLLDAFYFFRS